MDITVMTTDNIQGGDDNVDTGSNDNHLHIPSQTVRPVDMLIIRRALEMLDSMSDADRAQYILDRLVTELEIEHGTRLGGR
jgi:hypothetical protein